MPVLDHILRTPILDDELPEYHRFIELAGTYYDPTPADRLFKVPVAEANEFSRLLNLFKRHDVKIVRRAGGPRYDSLRMTCLVKNAKYFTYYLREVRPSRVETLRADPTDSNRELMEICDLHQSPSERLEQIIAKYNIGLVDATWLRDHI